MYFVVECLITAMTSHITAKNMYTKFFVATSVTKQAAAVIKEKIMETFINHFTRCVWFVSKLEIMTRADTVINDTVKK